MAKQQKNNLVKNASILMVATIISRIIGLIYRRPLGSVLGSVGLGYYGYASNLYAILLLISSYSIPMAVSKIVSERLALRRYKSAQKVFRGALMYAAIVGGVAALIAFFGGSILLPANQQNALPALRVLAPTIFLSAILGVFRGYFQAHQTMTPTSVSQICEQIMNAFISVFAAWMLIRTFAGGDKTQRAILGAVGGTMGTGAGVITGLIVMLIIFGINRSYFRRERRHDHSNEEESYGEVIRIIFLMVTPIIFTTFINNASTYLDSYLFSSILGWHGVNSDTISSWYGEYSNYYIPMINIPLSLASASASAMMPEVSGEYATGRISRANHQINQTIRLTMFITLPCMIGMMVLAYPIMGVLFPSASNLASKLLFTGAIYVLPAALSTITGSVLQSIGEQKTALINAGISLVLNLVILAAMLLVAPGMGIYAVMIANILYSVFYAIFNQIMIARFLGFKNEFLSTYIQPLMASLIMGAGALAIYELIFHLTRRPFIGLVVSILIAILIYMVSYVFVSGTTEKEMKKFPMGTKIVRVLRILRVYR